MKKNVNKIVYFILFALTICGCAKETNYPIIMVTPSETFLVGDTSEIKEFLITCQKGSADLSKFKISYYIEGKLPKVLFDTAISGSEFVMAFKYKIPVFSDTTSVILEFNIKDADNNDVKTGKRIDVNCSIKEPVLKETTGCEIYSWQEAGNNTYDLLNGISTQSGFAADKDVHLFALPDSTDKDRLSRKWITRAYLKFVKANGIDYANVTARMLANTYDAGVKYDFLYPVSSGDIYITKIAPKTAGANQYYAVKVIYVIDDVGFMNDKYVFSYKR